MPIPEPSTYVPTLKKKQIQQELADGLWICNRPEGHDGSHAFAKSKWEKNNGIFREQKREEKPE